MIELSEMQLRLLSDRLLIHLCQYIKENFDALDTPHCPATSGIIEAIHEQSKKLILALSRKTKLTAVQKIKESDLLRDQALRQIRNGYTFFSARRSSEFQDAAAVIKKAFKKHIREKTFSQNSVENIDIEFFLKELDTPEGEAAITFLDMRDEFDTLRNESMRFEELVLEKHREKEAEKVPLLLPTRRALYREIRALESFLNHKLHRGSEWHHTFVTSINGHIDEMMKNAKARQTRQENKETARVDEF